MGKGLLKSSQLRLELQGEAKVPVLAGWLAGKTGSVHIVYCTFATESCLSDSEV